MILKPLIYVLIFISSSTSLAQSKFSAGAMVLYGTGSMGNSTDVLSRSMVFMPIDLFAGFNIKKFRLGFNYEYNLVGQSAEPADFSNQNIGGSGSATGLRLEYYDGKQAAGVVCRLGEKYTLTKPTAAGGTVRYDGKLGFGFQYYRSIKNKFGVVIDFTSGEMTSPTGDTADIKWNRMAIGMVFTNFSK